MDLKYYIKKLWYKLIYALSVIVYLIFLNKLNKELLSYPFDTSFDLLGYKEGIALKFFVVALVLFILGCLLIYREYKKFKIGLDDIEEMIIAVATIIICGILLLLIFDFINNPILRAILVSISIIVVGVKALAS